MRRKVFAIHLGLVAGLLLIVSLPLGASISSAKWSRLDKRVLILERRFAGEVALRRATELGPAADAFARRQGCGVTVLDASGRVLAIAGTGPTPPNPTPPSPTPQAAAELARRAGGDRLVIDRGRFAPGSKEIVVAAERVGAGPLRGATVLVGAGTDRVRAHLRLMWLSIALTVIAGLAVTACCAGVVLRWTQAPIRLLESVVGGPDRSGHVVPLAAAHTWPRDVRRLADRMNRAAATSRLVAKSNQLMMADIAHQLRTRLQLLGFRLERLAVHTCPLGSATHAKAMADMERLRDSMDELIEIQRESPPVSVAVRPVVGERIAAWSDIAESRGLTLTAGALASSVILAQRGVLDQLLDILLDNAIKFSPARGRITVSALAEGSDVTVQVVDEGRGMSAEDRAHATARGWCGNESERAGGRGLGLSIATMLVVSNGGTLTLNAGPGGSGLDVRIRFPLIDASGPSPLRSAGD